MRTFLLFLVILAAGCKGAMTEGEYASAFNTECEKYHAKAKQIEVEPWPKMKGFTREQRLKAIAEKVKGDTAIYAALAADFKQIQPPQSRTALHKAYQDFLDGQVRINKAYAAAIESGDSEGGRLRNREFIAFLESQMGLILEEMQKAGIDTSKLRESLEDVFEKDSSSPN